MPRQASVFASAADILIIQLGDIGDVVLTLPCIRALRETYPEARIHAAVWEKAAEIVVDSQWVDEVIRVHRESGPMRSRLSNYLSFLRDLRKRRIDLAIDLRTGTRGAILARLSGARRRVGFSSGDEAFWRDRLFTHLASPEQQPGDHIVDFNLSLLGAFGITTTHRWPVITPPAQRMAAVQQLLRLMGVSSDLPLVVVQPFSLWPYKEWPPHRYSKLVKTIVREHSVQVAITGSAGERERAAKLCADCGHGVFDLCGQTSIGEYAALLKHAALFIGVDSAGMHLAAAVKTPTVLIFGPSSDADWAPRGEIHRVVRAGLNCEPCFAKGCEGTGKSRCIEALEVAKVAAVVQAALKSAFHDMTGGPS